MKLNNLVLGLWISLAFVGMVFAWPGKVEKKTVAFESLKKYIKCDFFQPDFVQGDSGYTAIISASDGKIYFSVGTHNTDYACRFYSFDPAAEKLTFIAELDKVMGEDSKKQFSHGKVHTRIFEHKGKLWFATHTAFYQKSLSGSEEIAGLEYGDKGPYKGGCFVSYDLKNGRFTKLAQVLPNEGIISMAMDKAREILYGITWPSGILVSYDIKTKDLRCWGAVQGRGEQGHKPSEWSRICRTLTVDADGFLYGSTMDGRIWKYDPDKVIRVGYIKGLDLSRVPFSQSAEETMKGRFQNGWRTIEWNEKTKSFWGLHFECTTLFEFVPSENYIRAVAELRPEAYFAMPRNPEISQLGFTIGPENTIFYLANGPAVEIKGRENTPSSLYLITYEIDKGKYTNHGPILSEDSRRVFFSESIVIGADDHIYSVAWVDIADPERAVQIKAVRLEGAPEETEEVPYEMFLVRLPKWQYFLK